MTWLEQAECRGVDPDLFHPERGGSVTEAKAVCAVCPVRQECLDHALDHREKSGIWGGLSERERSRIRPRRGQMLHGTRARYVGSSSTPPCRCDLCREANSGYQKHRSAA